MGFSEAPLVQKIALVLYPLSCLLEIIGMASPYWVSASETIQGIKFNLGIWTSCFLTICQNITDAPGWLNGVRALEILGMLAIIVASVCTALSIFMSSESMQRMGKIVAVVTSFVAAAFIIVGVAIYAAKLVSLDPSNGALDLLHYLSWAFGLCIAAAILSGIGGVLSILALVM